MNYTREQNDAINTSAHKVLVTAAAGSGKTHVLAQRFILLLAKNPNMSLSSIVAITFTRAAANEMKERVHDYIKQQIRNATDIREKRKWFGRIAELPNARIQTIHSFCSNILRENAANLGIDPNFRILDEAESASLIDEVIKSEFSKYVDVYQKHSPLFEKFSFSEIKAVLQSNRYPLGEIPNSQTLMDHWVKDWASRAGTLFDEFIQRDLEIPTYIPQNDLLGERWQQAVLNIEKITQSDCLKAKYTHVKEMADIKLNNVGKVANWNSKKEKEYALETLKVLVRSARQYRDKISPPPDESDQTASLFLQLWVDLIRRIQERIRENKWDQNELDYDDLEWICCQLLSEDQVRQRYQQEFKHILVDEFQDVNQLQWKIFTSLSEENERVSLFLVGDPRQSIYSFRGADVSVINEVKKRVKQDFSEHALSISFRSNTSLQNALNYFFDQLFKIETKQKLADYEVKTPRKITADRADLTGEVPSIELFFVNQSSLVDVWKRTDRNAVRKWEALLLSQRLIQIVTDQEEIHEKQTDSFRPAQFSDIAILFRSFSDINLYEEVFSICGLPFNTYAGRGFFDRQEIWDVINLLSFLENPLNELALASVLRSPIGNLSDDALFALRSVRDTPNCVNYPLLKQIYRAIDREFLEFPYEEIPSLMRFIRFYEELISLSGHINVFELIYEILNRSNYVAIVNSLYDGEQSKNNLKKLIEIARDRGDILTSDFLDFVRSARAHDIKIAQAEIASTNTVSLTSIHSSKGLEFPIVALADVGRATKKDPKLLFLCDESVGVGPACKVLDNRGEVKESYSYRRTIETVKRKAAAEDKRLMYVAATRARDRLLISGIVSEKADGSWKKEGEIWESIINWFGRNKLMKVRKDTPVYERYPWGKARIHYATVPPKENYIRPYHSSKHKINKYTNSSYHIDKNVDLTLLKKLGPPKSKVFRHISASRMGQANYQEQNFELTDNLRSKNLGTLLHAILHRHPLPKVGKPLQEYVCRIGLNLGIGFQKRDSELIDDAIRILEKYRKSDLYIELSAVNQTTIFREFPFTYRTENSLIHGRIDLLYKNKDDFWCIVDYKTNSFRKETIDTPFLLEYSNRYIDQLSTYYKAISSSRKFQPLRVGVHYLQYGQTIIIPGHKLSKDLKIIEI